MTSEGRSTSGQGMTSSPTSPTPWTSGAENQTFLKIENETNYTNPANLSTQMLNWVSSYFISNATMVTSKTRNRNVSEPTESPGSTTEMVLQYDIEKMAEFFIAYVSIATVIIGLFGNFLTIYIFLKQKNWEKYPLHFLFVLAFADSGVLIFYGLFEWIGIGLEIATDGAFYYDIKNSNSVACKISVYMFVASACLSAWMVVLVTFERLLAVTLPLKASSIMSVERRRKLSIAIPIFIFLFDTPELFICDTKPIYKGADRRSCLPDWELPVGTQVFALALIFVPNNIVPSVLIVIMNIVIISKIVCLKGSRGNLGVCKRRLIHMEVAMASKLLIISTMFVVTMGTHATFWTIYYLKLFNLGQTGVSMSQKTVFTLAKFSTRVALINFTINFIVYCFTYDFYMKYVKKIFCPCLGPNRRKYSPERSNSGHCHTQERSGGSLRLGMSIRSLHDRQPNR